MSEVIRLESVNKYFNKGKVNQVHVLKNVNLTVDQGEFITIMGPSGSGKSTLLYAMSGMDAFDEGQITMLGKSLGQCREKELSKIRLNQLGFVFQENHLLKNLSIRDNILYKAYAMGSVKRKEIMKKVDDLMKMTGIDGIADNDVTQASGGQLQRVGICRALINEPKILFADEPTGALNSSSTKAILDLLNKINGEEKTIVLVTHDVRVAARSKRVIYMCDGQVKGETENLVEDTWSQEESYNNKERVLTDWLQAFGF